MSGTIVGAPQVQQYSGGGIALTFTADIPVGESVLYYTVNIYDASTNVLVTTIKLLPPPEPTSGTAVWDFSNWDGGTWGGVSGPSATLVDSGGSATVESYYYDGGSAALPGLTVLDGGIS